ncbi:MAG: AraC family transcriptional regulator [Saprospiraceae bacterium]
MESIQTTKKVFHSAEVDLKGQANVKAYETADMVQFDLQASPLELLLFCCKSGSVQLQASFIPHPVEINQCDAIFLAFPRSDWQVKIITETSSSFFVTRMEIGTLHKLINPNFEEAHLQQESRMNLRDLMRIIPMSPSTMMSFDQLFHHKINPPFKHLFEQGKFFEIFSLLMETAFGHPSDICPVAMSHNIEQKLNQVRKHIIDHIEQIPVPESLALKFELPRNTLKEGYKFQYGQTIHQFHSDYKLDIAMQMLHSGEYLVKEVAFKIGYQNPSHFISAFKKKFGHTPKQYFKTEAVKHS